jgi:ketosteroid isomerase-like protein
MSQDPSFEEFLRRRSAASDAWVNGDAGPLSPLLATEGEATFFGPMGGALSGAEQVAKRYEQDAARFAAGSTNRIDVLQSGCDGDVGFAVSRQLTQARLAERPDAVPMELRVTEIYRREAGGWKLVHRHADMLAEPKPPAGK